MPGRFDNYIQVKDRVHAAADSIQLLQSDIPTMLTDVLGYIRVTITLVDGRTATGIAQFRLDATTGAQKTNPLEDAETSAVGRALAFLGYSADRGIASREDVQRAQAAQRKPPVSMGEAWALFWSHWEPTLGGKNWPAINALCGREVEMPQSVEQLRALYQELETAMAREAAAANEAARHE